MNKTKYLQYDSKWSSLGYPKSPCTIGNSGCGEVSVVNCIIEMDKYKGYTPKTIQPYCKQFADPSCNGTYWSGIPTLMKHYGLTDVKEHSTMPSLFTELAKGDRVAIYLMGSRLGGSKRVRWTCSGHFVCSVEYKKKDGKNYVYVKDSYSNSSLRNGWITYEENMRGAVLKVWSGKLTGKLTDGRNVADEIKSAYKEVPSKGEKWKIIRDKGLYMYDEPSKSAKKMMRLEVGTIFTVHDTKVGDTSCFAKIKKDNKWGWVLIYDKNGVYCINTSEKRSYDGKYPSTTLVKSNAQVLSDACKFAKIIANDNDFHYGLKPYSAHNGCYFCGNQPKTKKDHIKMWETTYCCNPFVTAVLGHGGCIPTMLSACKKARSWQESQFRESKEFDNLGKPAKSKLKAGDVLCCHNGHVMMYVGDGKLAEAANGDDNVPYSNKWNKSISVSTLSDTRWNSKSYGVRACFRYNGKVSKKMDIIFGEYSDRVKDLQKYLNWYNPKSNLKVDGLYGKDTLKAVKSFQEKEMGKGQGDGLVGQKTIDAMKKVKK